MSHLEQILTLVVWALVACVFFYYRSLALKQQRNQNQDGNHRKAHSHTDARP
jgi:hypothetical protein